MPAHRLLGPAVLVGLAAGTVVAGLAYGGIAGSTLRQQARLDPGPAPSAVLADAAPVPATPTCGPGSVPDGGGCVVTVVVPVPAAAVTATPAPAVSRTREPADARRDARRDDRRDDARRDDDRRDDRRDDRGDRRDRELPDDEHRDDGHRDDEHRDGPEDG